MVRTDGPAIRIAYGARGNAELLLRYGFTAGERPNSRTRTRVLFALELSRPIIWSVDPFIDPFIWSIGPCKRLGWG